MKSYLLFSVLLILTGWTYAQGPGSIENIDVSQRTGEEERVVDIAFTLSGGDYYAIKLGIKFHEGDDFTPIEAEEFIWDDPEDEDIIDAHLDETIIGAIVVEAGEIELTWDGRESYAEIDAAAARVEITAARGLKDIDGNFYKTVLIGDQEWMAENLRVTRYNNNVEIFTDSDVDWATTVSGTYAVYPYEDVDGIYSHEEMVEAYGKLYNWYAVNDARGLCPTGWRVPTNDEWTALVDYIEDTYEYHNDSDSDDINGVGNALKSCRQVGDSDNGDCDTSDHPRWNADDTHSGFDEFGFSALPGGGRYTDGAFLYLGEYGIWWFANAGQPGDALRRWVSHYEGIVRSDFFFKTAGFSVRCVRDIVRTEDE